jgi:hypothetical protein
MFPDPDLDHPSLSLPSDETLAAIIEADGQFPIKLPDSQAEPLSVHHLKEVCEYAKNRRVIYCAEGRMGLAPKTVQTGDVILALHGAVLAIILRPLNCGKYSVIGECFYDGDFGGDNDWKMVELDTFTLV